jgi:hypothetical protein
MSEFNACIEKGVVSFGDDFDSVAEVTHLFGLTASKLPYHNWFKIPDLKDTAACLLTAGDKGWHNVRETGPNMDKHGWNEILSMCEWNDEVEETQNRIQEELEHPCARYVFCRESRYGAKWFKFYGVFIIDAAATRATLATEYPRVVYVRSAISAPCRKFEKVRKSFSDEEFKTLKNRMVRVCFETGVFFVADCGEIVRGEVKAWPGMEFVVTDISPDCTSVICATKDVNLLADAQRRIPVKFRNNYRTFQRFEIIRQEFNWGYFEVLQKEP